MVLLAGALPLPAAAEEAVQVSALSALTEALNAGGQRIVLTATIEIDQDTTMDLRGSSIETADGVRRAAAELYHQLRRQRR